MFMKTILTAFLLLFIPLACSNNAENSKNTYNSPEADTPVVLSKTLESQNIQSDTQNNLEQKLIKEAFLVFETQDLDKTFSQVVTFINNNKGYIQNDNSSKSYNRVSRQITVRIPTQNFQPTIDSISQSVKHFDRKNISSKDVTEEFIDLEARLKAKRELENRYLELLAKAKNVKEILEVEKELSQIREDIEAKQGRLQYLQNKVSLSTIHIEFYKTIATESGVTVSYAQKMWNALKSGFNGLSYFVLGLLTIWPAIIIIGFSIFMFRRWLKKRNK